jgi:antitoxin YefM
MYKHLPMTQARHELTSLPERLAEEPGAVAVTRRGEPVLAILSWDFYESLLETLEVLSDDDLMTALRQSLKEADRGETIPWEKVKAEMDL